MHIGSHKAGSTSIQEFCYTSTEFLRNSGIYYPNNLFKNYPQQHSELRGLVAQDQGDRIANILVECIKRASEVNSHTVFLSGEDLSALGPALAHRLYVLAEKLFSDIEIVLIVRNKRDYLYSSYKHHLLYVGATGEYNFVARQKFSPKETALSWSNFDRLSLKVLSFEAIKTDLLGNFFAQIFGIKVHEKIASNQSLDYVTLQIINTICKNLSPKIMNEVMKIEQRYKGNFKLPIEDVIADNLNGCYPDEDWEIPGYDFGRSLIERRVIASEPCDYGALCEKIEILAGAIKSFCLNKNGQSV
jgi:hypothetical protein